MALLVGLKYDVNVLLADPEGIYAAVFKATRRSEPGSTALAEHDESQFAPFPADTLLERDEKEAVLL